MPSFLRETQEMFVRLEQTANSLKSAVQSYSSPDEIPRQLFQDLRDCVARAYKLEHEHVHRGRTEKTRLLAHNLNNLLTSIMLGASALKNPKNYPDAAIYVDVIGQVASRANSLVEQIIHASRDVQKQDLSGEANEVFGLFKPGMLNLYCAFDATNFVMADHNEVHSVIENLLVNARDATHAKGNVAIGTRENGVYIILSVSDTGSGIAPEVLPRIFDFRFTTKPKGTGIGLYAVKTIVESYGGRIDVDTALGEGTTFAVSLPLVKRKILLVDDEPCVLQTGKCLLERQGYEVTAVGDFQSALNAFNPSIDLVVTDIVMHAHDGLELVQQLRKQAPGTRIYGWTAAQIDSGKDYGLDAILHKPEDTSRLAEIVKTAFLPQLLKAS